MVKTDWLRLLGYVTGLVNQELLLKNEYLVAENRILRAQIKGRLLLSDDEKATLAEIAKRLGRKALAQIALRNQIRFWLGTESSLPGSLTARNGASREDVRRSDRNLRIW
jgi:hypothetical protein